MSEFDEYIVHGEPGQREKAAAWQTAIGLQDVDGLKVSAYLLDTARRHIEGDISIDEVRERIKVYYENTSGHNEDDENTFAPWVFRQPTPCSSSIPDSSVMRLSVHNTRISPKVFTVHLSHWRGL